MQDEWCCRRPRLEAYVERHKTSAAGPQISCAQLASRAYGQATNPTLTSRPQAYMGCLVDHSVQASSVTSTPPSAPLTTNGRTTRSQLTRHEPQECREVSIDLRIASSLWSEGLRRDCERTTVI